MEKTDLSMDVLRHKAEAYCRVAEHCAGEVREKLFQWGADEKMGDAILVHLKKERFIDDERYCRAYTHDKILYQGWGRIKVRMMLQSKHLPDEAIVAGMCAVDDAQYEQVLRQVAAKKKGATSEQVARFLIQRGFESSRVFTFTKLSR